VCQLLAWFGCHARDLPWRRTQDAYAIWVSEIMLQQTQVKTVLPYWERWMRAVPDIRALAAARPEKLHKLWEGLGYYTRVRNLQQAARVILEKHGGAFPEDYEAVLALPGIGRYTAGAISSIAFNQPRPILDGNVTRVLARLFALRGDPRARPTNARLWRLAESLVRHAAELESGPTRGAGILPALPAAEMAQRAHKAPRAPRACSRLNQALMELGALVCAARTPQCGACPVADLCAAYQQGCVGELPRRSPRARPTARQFAAFVLEQRGRFFVRQRPAGVVNAHLWEFPNLELGPGDPEPRVMAQRLFGIRPAALEPLCAIKHSITRYRITLEVFRATGECPFKPAPGEGRWLYPGQLRQRPFASAHKKILLHLNSRKESSAVLGEME
jgi:A/G-specific adenine glycosylase